MRLRAVIVDDEDPARDRLRGLLEEHGGVDIVGEAADGDAALERIAALEPDVVFLDIAMPGRSGLEVVPALEPPRPHVVFCTAYDAYALDAFEQHATDYLLKPVNRDRLRRTLERILADLGERRDHAREVEAASATQRSLLRAARCGIDGLDAAGRCHPARGVGGDYYDLIELDGGRLGIAVGDVAGKGLYAGLLMASVQARLRTLARETTGAPETVVGALERALSEVLDHNRFVSLFWGELDASSGRLRYVNAGHCPPVVVRGVDAARLDVTAPVLGAPVPARFAVAECTLAPGEGLIAYTDGLSESRSPDDEEWGDDRVARAAIEAVRESAREDRAERVADALLDGASRWRAGAAADDDVTVAVVLRERAAGGSSDPVDPS